MLALMKYVLQRGKIHLVLAYGTKYIVDNINFHEVFQNCKFVMTKSIHFIDTLLTL